MIQIGEKETETERERGRGIEGKEREMREIEGRTKKRGVRDIEKTR